MELKKLINLFTEQQTPQTQTDRSGGSFRGTEAPPAPVDQMRTAQDFAGQPKTAGPRQGVVGSELSRISGGQFTSRADRLNQDKVNAALGVNPATGQPYVAGRADTNLALRNLYRQGGPKPQTAPAPKDASPPPPSTSNEKSKETVATPKTDAAAPAPAPAPAPEAPKAAAPATVPTDINSATAAERSGQNIGGQFAKAASDKAAQDSFALVTGMAPKLDARSAVPAAPTADAPAAAPPMKTAQDFAGSGTVDQPEQPQGVFSRFMPGQASGTDNEAGAGVQNQAQSAPTKQYGGGYNPAQVQYAVDAINKSAPAADDTVKSGTGLTWTDGSGRPISSGAGLKRGPLGNIIPEQELEEQNAPANQQSAPANQQNAPANQLNPMTKTIAPANTNRAPSMYDIERANKKEIASQFDPKSTYQNPHDKNTTASSPGSKPVNTVADFEESVEHELAEMLRLSGLPVMEKAVSRQQQKFMGMVHAMQKGEKVKGASPELKKAAKGMSKKDARDFAKTKHKGLPQKVNEGLNLMLDEGGHTLTHIVNRYKHEVRKFIEGDFMPENLYDALYDYYLDRGDMPYGTAKGREGDPYQWVSERFYDDVMRDLGNDMNETVQLPVIDEDLNDLARLAGLREADATPKFPSSKTNIDPGMTRMLPSKKMGDDPGINKFPPAKNTDPGMTKNLKQPDYEQLFKSVKNKEVDEGIVSRQEGRSARGPGLNECGDNMDMEQQDSFNVSTNMSTDGTRNVTVSAEGDRADELLQMLKMAGMRPHDDHSVRMSEPEVIVLGGNNEMMDEAKKDRTTKYRNTPDEEYQSVASITRQGNDLNREKKQFAGKPRLGDNPMAEGQMEFDRELVDLLDSVLIKKDVDENSNTPNPYPVGQDALSPQEKLNPTNNPNKSIVRGIKDFITNPLKPGM